VLHVGKLDGIICTIPLSLSVLGYWYVVTSSRRSTKFVNKWIL